MDRLSPARTVAVTALATAMLAASMPAAAQDEAAEADAGSAGDAISLIPAEIGGRTLDVQTFRGEEIREAIDADDPEQVQDVADMEAMLADVGAGFEQLTMSSASAFDETGGVVAFVLEVDGTDASSFIDRWMTVFARGEYDNPKIEDGEFAGKTVKILTNEGIGTGQTTYGYAVGDAVIVAFGDEDSVTEIISALP